MAYELRRVLLRIGVIPLANVPLPSPETTAPRNPRSRSGRAETRRTPRPPPLREFRVSFHSIQMENGGVRVGSENGCVWGV